MTHPRLLGYRPGGRSCRSYGYPSLTVVRPWVVYEDRTVATVVQTYVQQPIIEQTVIEQPVVQESVPDFLRSEQPPGEPIGPGAVTLLPPPEPVSPQDAQDTLRRGDAAFAVGDYAEARRHYIQAQLEGVYAGEATLAYGLARFAEGQYAVSAMALRRGLTAVPDAIDYPLDIALLYGDPEPLQRHLDTLAEQLTLRPDDTQAWFVLGYVRFGQGDPLGAVDAFERCIALDPQDALALLLRDAAMAATDLQRQGPTNQGAAPSPDVGTPAMGLSLQAATPELT
ncbi:MAG TPA: tetratricopeptide repeat protein [Phycisphaerae bacterium]|nr:tetratricopeptide repeat protein [Phycisphaerae bacterium]